MPRAHVTLLITYQPDGADERVLVNRSYASKSGENDPGGCLVSIMDTLHDAQALCERRAEEADDEMFEARRSAS